MPVVHTHRQTKAQPQGDAAVDWSNPLTRSLVGLYGPTGIEHVKRLPAVEPVPTAANIVGVGQSFAGGSQRAKFGDISVTSAGYTAFTVLIPAFSSTSNARQGIWHAQATEGVIDFRLRMIWLDSANGFYVDTNAGYAYRTVPVFSAGDLFSIAFVRSADGLTNQFYVNGAPATTVTVVGGTGGTPSGPTPMFLGADVEAGGRGMVGQILTHAHIARALSSDEVGRLHANPMGLLRSQVQRRPAPPTTSAPSSLNVAASNITSSGARATVTLAF